jgi:hypothetical protein
MISVVATTARPDPHPQEPAVIIAAAEHQVGALRGFKLGVGTMLSDQQVGSTISSTAALQGCAPSACAIVAKLAATIRASTSRRMAFVASVYRHSMF